MTRKNELVEVLENEWYAVRHSGEIPEIALYSSLYYLTEDESGPGLKLAPEQCRMLVEAAESRYREIVLRDLRHANSESSSYRGVRRAIANWQRFETFCRRQQLDCSGFKREVAAALLVFLSKRHSSLNCTFAELSNFADQLGLVSSVLPAAIRPLCLD